MINFDHSPNPRIRWSRELTAERYPLPLSPLGWTNIQAVFDQGVRRFAQFMGITIGAREELATLDRGWVVANAEAFDFRDKFKIRLSAVEWLGVLGEVVTAFAGSNDGLREFRRILRFISQPAKEKTKLGSHLSSVTLHLAGTTVLTFLNRTSRDLEKSWPSTLADFQKTVARIDLEVAGEPSWEGLLSLGDQLREAMIAYINPDLVIFAVKEIASLMLGELARLAQIENPRDIPATLGLSLESNVTIEFHRKLFEIGQELQRQGWPGRQMSPEFQKKVSAFTADYGHVTSSWDILHPTWGEDQERFLNLALQAKPVHKQKISEVEQTQLDGFFGRLQKYPFALSMAENLTAILRRFMIIDEEHHFHTGRVIPVTRRIVLKLGEFLASRGIISDPDMIFWLSDSEIRVFLRSSSSESQINLVQKRKSDYESALNEGYSSSGNQTESQSGKRSEFGNASKPTSGRRSSRSLQSSQNPQNSVDFPKTEFVIPTMEGNRRPDPEFVGGLRGLGVSHGIARGRVRRAATLEEINRIQDGEILVTRSPDPTLTVVFPKISGIISETGAVLSHGAVAAREYRLPAVFGVKNAWKHFPDGTFVEVDGSRGLVKIVEKKDDKCVSRKTNDFPTD
ncbi:MAG: PEP-utilizing enzyme [Candidatus Ozemobacteraceae bacterium]